MLRVHFNHGYLMFNAAKLLQDLLRNPTARGVAGGLAGGFLASPGGRRLAGSALKLGGLAAIGAMAYRAYENNQASKAVDPELAPGGARAARRVDELELPPASSGFLPAATDHEAQHRLGLVLVRAMIAAARCDGRLDASETAHILAGLDTHGLSKQERAELRRELARPADLEELVAAGATPQIAAEIYIAARGAIDPDTAAERAWLAALAARLRLDEGLVDELERALAD